jgi:hypothetical protein
MRRSGFFAKRHGRCGERRGNSGPDELVSKHDERPSVDDSVAMLKTAGSGQHLTCQWIFIL